MTIPSVSVFLEIDSVRHFWNFFVKTLLSPETDPLDTHTFQAQNVFFFLASHTLQRQLTLLRKYCCQDSDDLHLFA